MAATKADIIAQLQRDILPFQGISIAPGNAELDATLGQMRNAFPGASFPLGAIHEFISNAPEDGAATSGFVAGILSSLMRNRGALIWISTGRTVFPPAFPAFGISPDRIIFIDLHREKEVLWTMEEALKCRGLSAVVGEMKELNFIASRRLQLAVEKSRVTGFILRHNPRSINTTSCLTRWQVTALQSEPVDGLPGLGFPRWNVELLKVRNGTPGKWEIEFADGRFRHVSKVAAIPFVRKKKAG